jgi:uncharacterized membrane protein YhfC
VQALNVPLVVCFVAAIAVELLAPVVLVAGVVRRGGSWRYVFLGAAVMLVFQGILRVPAMLALQAQPSFQGTLKESPGALWLFLLFAAFTAGLFEEGGRWLALRFVVPPQQRTHSTALAMGAGHGGIESIAIGLVALASFIVYLLSALSPQTLSEVGANVDEIQRQFSAQTWQPLLGAWERLSALAIQVGLSVMVLQAFLRGARWWWLALGAHTLVDFTAVGLLQLAVPAWGQTAAIFAVEVMCTLYAATAILFVRAMREPAPPPSTASEDAPLG